MEGPTGTQKHAEVDVLGRSNHPWLAKFLSWKYARKIRKIERKYVGGERNGASFTLHKVYRLLLLRIPEQACTLHQGGTNSGDSH